MAVDGDESALRWAAIKAQAEASPFSPPASTDGEPYSPPSLMLDKADMTMFSSTTSARCDAQQVVQCPDCSKPLLQSALVGHQATCELIRERAKNSPAVAASQSMKRSISDASADSAAASTSPAKKAKSPSLVITLGDSKKKLKAEKKSTQPPKGGAPASTSVAPSSDPKTASPSSASTSTKTNTASTSAKADAAAAAAAKARGPVDVDKQCGVINDKGFPCSRSLTCKTHSMGAKRSVPHRSQPYDILLHEWQKATKPDFGNRKPVQPRVGPGSEAYGAGGEGGKKRKKGDASPGRPGGGGGGGGSKREKREKAALKAAAMMVGEWEESDPEGAGGDGADAVIDSDEEVEAVLRGLERIPKGRPLGGFGAGGGMGFSAPTLFIGRNIKLARMRDDLGGAFAPVASAGGN